MSEPMFEGHAIVELLGHRVLIGQAREVEFCGAKLLRLDVALPEGRSWPQFYAASALYAVTPTTIEAMTDTVRLQNQSNMARWSLLPPHELADFQARWAAELAERQARYAARLTAGHSDDDDDDDRSDWGK
jgi:hypothetical protein